MSIQERVVTPVKGFECGHPACSFRTSFLDEFREHVNEEHADWVQKPYGEEDDG